MPCYITTAEVTDLNLHDTDKTLLVSIVQTLMKQMTSRTTYILHKKAVEITLTKRVLYISTYIVLGTAYA